MNLSLPFAEWEVEGEAESRVEPTSEPAHEGQPPSHEDAAWGLMRAAEATALAPEATALAPEATALAPEALHPALWRASQLGGGRGAVTASGHPALDAELPGGGWPHGALTELLLPQPGIGELRLLAPALAALSAPAGAPVRPATSPDALRPTVAAAGVDSGGARSVMLFDPPALLSAWALRQQGLAPGQWLVVRGRSAHPPRGTAEVAPRLPSADLLWALEHTLRSGAVGAVLAWLPLALRADALRRLQLAAQACAGPVFVFRETEARRRPSPAPLRLLLQPAGVGGLALRVLKRRGPPQAKPLRLDLAPVLTPRQQAQALARQAMDEAAAAAQRGRPAAREAGPASAASPRAA